MTNKQLKYQREWRKKHPHYTRDWNRSHRNAIVKDITLPNQRTGRPNGSKDSYERIKKGHCDKCTILLTSIYAIGHDGITCGNCLSSTPLVLK